MSLSAQRQDTGSVEGELYDANTKAGLSGVTVWLQRTHDAYGNIEWMDAEHTEYTVRYAPSEPKPTSKTDLHGNFVISSAPPGEYFVLFYTAEYVDPRPFVAPGSLSPEVTKSRSPLPAFVQKVTVTKGKITHVDLPLQRGGVIEGRVTCADGQPSYIAASTVTPYPGTAVEAEVKEPDGSFGRGFGLARTDKDGNYRIEGLPEATYVVFSAFGDEEPVSTSCGSSGAGGTIFYHGNTIRPSRATGVTVTGSEPLRSHVDLTFPSTGFHIVRGKVETPDGSPIVTGSVVLTPSGESGVLSGRQVSVRLDGTFQFFQVLDDTYTLSTRFEPVAKFLGTTSDGQGTRMKYDMPAYSPAKQNIIVSGNDSAPVVLHLAAAK